MRFVEKKVKEELVYGGRIFSVYRAETVLPNGSPAERDRIAHPGGAGIVALNEKNEIYLVRQYRFGVDRELLEIPAGKLEPGEDSQAAVIRELQEEAGLFPRRVESLGHMELSPAYLGEITYLYLGRDLSPAKAKLDDDEFLEVLTMPFETALQKVLSGEISDGKTQTGILKTALFLQQENRSSR